MQKKFEASVLPAETHTQRNKLFIKAFNLLFSFLVLFLPLSPLFHSVTKMEPNLQIGLQSIGLEETRLSEDIWNIQSQLCLGSDLISLNIYSG